MSRPRATRGRDFAALTAVTGAAQTAAAQSPPDMSQPAFAHHALAAALPADADAAPPEWIAVFPKIGPIETRDGRRFTIDAPALVARFNADGVHLPVDINHATHHAAATGARADAVGWITQLEVRDGALMGKVDWLDAGRAALAARAYKFISPDFFHTADKVTTWLRSVALVTAPALANQKALAGALAPEIPKMEKLAAALGVVADASEDALVAALGAGFVEKKVHDAALAQLAATSTELAEIKASARKARVDALIEGALAEKKILPAEKEHYVQLCATDAGFDSVRSLLAARAAALPGSGLDDKRAPEAGEDAAAATPAQLAAEAGKLLADGGAADYFAAYQAVMTKHGLA